MYIVYGTKKYYETEYEKAKFIEVAVKKEVQEVLNYIKKSTDVDAEDLYLYAEMIESVEKKTVEAKQALDKFCAKVPKGN